VINPLLTLRVAGLLGLISLTGCADKSLPAQTGTNQPPSATNFKRIREPAVAGLFYPKDAAELSKTIRGLLATTPKESVPGLRAIICPHAGYAYSGPVAARAFKLLEGQRFSTVVLIAPSHYALFSGISVLDADAYRTPRGLVPVSPQAQTLSKIKPFVLEPKCSVQRPSWWGQSSRAAPEAGADTPETWEHSGEVEVPFLQQVLGHFQLVPMIFGQADPELAAQVLAGQCDSQTLFIASSDLSHYHPYEAARKLDERCVKAICDLDTVAMKSQEACGKDPILTLMHLAKIKGWKTKLLDYRNSGDVTGDRRNGVVGYAAIAFYESISSAYSLEDKRFLMDLAKRTVREAATQGRLPEVDANTVPQQLSEAKGCFVTLTKNGTLRGCIGHIVPQESLWKAVRDNARNAAVRDPRFPPVTAEELNQLEFEISILTPPKRLPFSSPDDLLNKLQPNRDGVVLQIGGRSATFLPQVWEQIPGSIDFLSALAQKAGAGPLDWRKPGVQVSVYHVEAFKESDLRSPAR
jgi:MEMO1 family protein